MNSTIFNPKVAAQLFDDLRGTSKPKERVALLKGAFAQDDSIKWLLLQHSHPYIQFYITECPTERPDAPRSEFLDEDIPTFDKFVLLASRLSRRELSGHAAQRAVHDFFSICNAAEEKVYETVLFRKPLNVAASLLNKACPNLIPKFKLMLADNKIIKIPDVRFPVEAQPKLDGFRAVHHPQQGFIGRNGQPIKNKKIHEVFEKLRTSGYVFDGELYSHELSFNEISSCLRSEDGPVQDIHYCVYDAMHLIDWESHLCGEEYSSRLAKVYELVQKFRSPSLDIRAVSSTTIRTVEDLEKFYQSQLEDDYEGAMVKSLNGLYQWKRVTLKSGIMAKIKPHKDYDGKIVAFEEGTNKNVGKLGAMLVQVKGIQEPVGVGTGFSQAQRVEFWAKRDELLGQWIRFRATEVTQGSKSLRFPRFKGIRDPK